MALLPSAPPAEPHHYLPPSPSAPPAEPLPSKTEPAYMPLPPSAPPATQLAEDPKPLVDSMPKPSTPPAEMPSTPTRPINRSSLDPQPFEPTTIREQLSKATPSSVTSSPGVGAPSKDTGFAK